MGLFVRPDGSTVEENQPASPGEILTVWGTGLGPYAIAPPDGYVLDERPGYTLVDAVSIELGEGTVIEPLYAGRSAAAVGVDAVRFEVPSSLPDSPVLPVRVRINGKKSNTVYLPVSR